MKIFRGIFTYIAIAIISICPLWLFNCGLFADNKTEHILHPITVSDAESAPVKVYIFYSVDCDSCKRTLEELNNIKQKNPGIILIDYELSEKDNAPLLFYLFDEMEVDELDYKIPVILLGDKVFLGEEEFSKGFQSSLDEALGQENFKNSAGELIEKYRAETSQSSQPETKEYIRIPVVVISALADSINPCAIGVIIILISSIIASKNRKYALISGIIYIAVIFIVYFLIGIGFIYLTKSIEIPRLFFIILGAILIVFGLFSAKDFFWDKKGFSLGIPSPIKNIIERNIYKATVISILVIGVLISIFEATCSGAVYFGILSIISRSGISLSSVLILLLYNFIFILPLLIILLVFYFGIPARKVQRLFIQKNRRIYRLVLGIILVLLGIYLIVWL
jgi:cytochrome c biogenesis protein CcdA